MRAVKCACNIHLILDTLQQIDDTCNWEKENLEVKEFFLIKIFVHLKNCYERVYWFHYLGNLFVVIYLKQSPEKRLTCTWGSEHFLFGFVSRSSGSDLTHPCYSWKILKVMLWFADKYNGRGIGHNCEATFQLGEVYYESPMKSFCQIVLLDVQKLSCSNLQF